MSHSGFEAFQSYLLLASYQTTQMAHPHPCQPRHNSAWSADTDRLAPTAMQTTTTAMVADVALG